MGLTERVEANAAALRPRLSVCPEVALILGTGLGELADAVEDAVAVPYVELPDFAAPRAPGHAGRLVVGRLEGVPVAAMQGRYHMYEGYSAAEAAFPVRVLQALGCRALIVTNAAGGMDPAHDVGDLMLIEDHIFLPGMAGHSPLRELDWSPGERAPFVDLNDAYDPALRALAARAAADEGIPLQHGVYAMVVGPHFETRAEIRALRALGAHAVGMSTCPEVVVARHCGLRVLGISCITNLALGDPNTTVDHEQVLAAGRAAGPRFRRLIRSILKLWGKHL